MKFLIDVNVLSEPLKPAPHGAVIEWLQLHEREIVVNPIIIGEIRLGIDLLPEGRRKQKLLEWFDKGIVNLACIPVDGNTAMHWAQLLAKLKKSGKAMPLNDSLIAATALQHNLTVATRNGKGFEHTEAKLFNPFDQ